MNDAELIKHLGGPAAVAAMLRFDKPGSVQRVANWVRRGIPARVKVDHPQIFMRKRKPVAPGVEWDAVNAT